MKQNRSRVRPVGLMLLALLSASDCSVAAAQSQSPAVTDPPAPTEDVESVDAILDALYDVISGPVGEPRDWDRLRLLFLPAARMIPTGMSPESRPAIRYMSVEDYIQRSGPLIEQIGFREREVARRTERFGNIVHGWSTYASYREDEEQPFLRGINSIQLFNDGSRWWIANILWEPERPENSLPQEYLRSGSSTDMRVARAQPEPSTTVRLVRHAEPGSGDPRDPALSAEGRERVESLLNALRDANLSAVYTSQFRRTRETGQPLAEQVGIPLHVFEVKGPDLAQYSQALLDHIRRTHPGKTVLVVGHSNTVPAFVQQATGSGGARCWIRGCIWPVHPSTTKAS